MQELYHSHPRMLTGVRFDSEARYKVCGQCSDVFYHSDRACTMHAISHTLSFTRCATPLLYCLSVLQDNL